MTNEIYSIEAQGQAVVNTVSIRYQSDSCIVYEIDMRSKYIEPGTSMGHFLFLDTASDSLYLSDEPGDTIIKFNLPEGKWSFACASGGRYTITVCYLKEGV